MVINQRRRSHRHVMKRHRYRYGGKLRYSHLGALWHDYYWQALTDHIEYDAEKIASKKIKALRRACHIESREGV